MHTPSGFFRLRKLIVCFGALIALGVSVGLFNRARAPHRVISPENHAAVASAHEEEAAATPREGAQSSSLDPTRSTKMTESGARVAAPELTRAFPSITQAVSNWREFRPATITVAPHADLPVTFTQIALKDEGRYVTWIGRNTAMPGASFVGVATEAGYDAIVVLPGSSQFSYHVRGDEVVVAESSPGEEGCGVSPVQPDRPATMTAGAIQTVQYVPGFEPRYDVHALEAALKVDVLVGYDADTLANATGKSSDPVGYIDAQSKAAIETCNLALNQSGVTEFTWRYIGAVSAPAYPRTEDSVDDIYAMGPGGAIFNWVSSIRYQRGADQIVLWIGGKMDFYGRAFNNTQTAVAPQNASSVVKWGASALAVAHEMAHNFGCLHDREHVTVTALGEYGAPAPDSNGRWCYGLMWTHPPVPPGYTGSTGTGGTIMSYADWRVPYFSNPNISVNVFGSMFGWTVNLNLGTYQLGRAETDPKAAYNTRVLNEQAKAMSVAAEEVVLPVITRHPAGGNVTRDSALTLSVAASGGGLSYQWKKDGVAIAGATSSIYSKTAANSDAGGYTVIVQNYAGTVTSTEAAVVVVAPTPLVVVASPSGSGGGGGGAPSIWFYSLLLAIGLGRWAKQRRPSAQTIN